MRVMINVTQDDIDNGRGRSPGDCMIARALKRVLTPELRDRVFVGIPQTDAKPALAPLALQAYVYEGRDDTPFAAARRHEIALPQIVRDRIARFDHAKAVRMTPLSKHLADLMAGENASWALPEPFTFTVDVPAELLHFSVPEAALQPPDVRQLATAGLLALNGAAIGWGVGTLALHLIHHAAGGHLG